MSGRLRRSGLLSEYERRSDEKQSIHQDTGHNSLLSTDVIFLCWPKIFNVTAGRVARLFARFCDGWGEQDCTLVVRRENKGGRNFRRVVVAKTSRIKPEFTLCAKL